jgi:hypothetical protein
MFLEDKSIGESQVRPVDEVSRVLHQAADLMAHVGHTKNRLQDAQGAVCIRGAIIVAAGRGYGTYEKLGGTPCARFIFDMDDEAGHNMYNLADARLQRLLCTEFPPEWNNAPERTSEEAIDALRSAAALTD